MLFPRQLNIKMLDHCNATCSFCGYSKNRLAEKIKQGFKPYTLDVDAILSKLPLLKKKGIGILHLTGGEPTMHPRFLEFVQTARKQGFSVRTGTNGSLLDEARIEAIIEARMDYLWYSLDTFPFEAHLEHRGFSSRASIMEKGLKSLIKRNVNVFGQTVLSRIIPSNDEGLPDLKGHVEYYRKTFNLHRFVLSYPMHRPNAAHHHLATEGGASVSFSQFELAAIIKSALKLKSENRGTTIVNPYLGLIQQLREIEGKPLGMPCMAGRDIFFLGPDESSLRPCYHLSDRIVDVLNDQPLQPAKDLMDCRDCSDQCFRDPSLVYASLSNPWDTLKGILQNPNITAFAIRDFLNVIRHRGYRHAAA